MEKMHTRSGRDNRGVAHGRQLKAAGALVVIIGTAVLLSLPSGNLPDAGSLVACLVILCCCLINKYHLKNVKI